MLAKFQKELYRNGNFSISLFKSEESVPEEKRRKSSKSENIFVAKGELLPKADLKYKMDGKWVYSNKYGWSFEVADSVPIVGKNKKDIIAYLETISGIGKAYSRKAYDRFGLDAIKVIKHKPLKLIEIGMTKKQADNAGNEINKKDRFHNLCGFLSKYEISAELCKSIDSRLGKKAYEKLKKNPYELCKIDIKHFPIAEKIANDLNIKLNSTWRISNAVLYSLSIQEHHGHVCVPSDDLISKTYKILNGTVHTKIIKEIIGVMFDEKNINHQRSHGVTYIYSSKMYRSEKQTAIKLAQMISLSNRTTADEINILKAIVEAQNEVRIKLSKSQKKAIKTAMENPVSIITGGPGTGKTTTLKILKTVCEQIFPDLPVIMMAPTGRAAKKMTENIECANAGTIHHVLNIAPDDCNEEDYKKTNIDINTGIDADSFLPPSIFIIDEFSMVDMNLMYEFIRRITLDSRIIIIGDPAQLPSVGPGNVLHEIIQSKQIPMTILDTIYRQKDKTSDIIVNANNIRHGQTIIEQDEHFKFIEESDISKVENIIVNQYMNEITNLHVPIDDVQILTPFKKINMPAATSFFNNAIQKLVNPPAFNKRQAKIGQTVYRVGDKIIQQRNSCKKDENKENYEVMNGDIGYIKHIYKNPSNNIIYFEIDFGLHMVRYTTQEMIDKDVTLAYAITVHKSQGSEYHTIIMPIVREHQLLMQRNLVYTGITRASEKAILVGQMNVLKNAVNRNVTNNRNSLLKERLKIYVPRAKAKTFST